MAFRKSLMTSVARLAGLAPARGALLSRSTGAAAARGFRTSAAVADAPRKDDGTDWGSAGDNISWDEEVQTYHGGQEWAHLENFKEDFSVTTNTLGSPKAAIEAARAAVGHCHHYPSADFEPAFSKLAKFIWDKAGPQELAGLKDQLMMGNGASELIDLVVRGGNQGGWKPGHTLTQYKEYERSCNAAGRPMLSADDTANAAVTCMVNPCNPTGDYMPVDEIKQYLEANTAPGSLVVVDESMQMWLGPHWREDSLTSQADWLRMMHEDKGVDVWIMHSWTKIWSCAGLRLGSVIGPTPEVVAEVKARQVPWSLNMPVIDFTAAAVDDTEYMEKTWEITPQWRAYTQSELERRHPTWTIHGEPFLSWLWVDTHDEAVAEQATDLAKAAGTPIRWGKPGYSLPTYLRVAVRAKEDTDHLLDAWSPLEK